MISKKLLVGGINADDSHILLDPKEYLNAFNLRFTTSENGSVGEMSNIEGNTLLNTTINSTGTTTTWSLPSGTNRTIGAYEDTPNKRVFFFNWNYNGEHGIYCYDSKVGLVYTVLVSSNTNDGLSFSNDITGVAMIGSLLYWTDGVNPQRRINVDAAIKANHPTYSTTYDAYKTMILGVITPGSGYTNGTYTNISLTGGTGSGAKATFTIAGGAVTSVVVTYGGVGYVVGDTLSASGVVGGSGFSVQVKSLIASSVINVIRNQPAYPVTVNKGSDGTYPNNLIQGEAFQFAYRFIYRDFETSVFSPFSKLMNINTATENTAGYDYISVTIPLAQHIEQDVIRVEVAVKYILGGKMSVIKTFDSGFEAHNISTALTFKFYNDTVGVSVDDATSVKEFDSVPITSGALEIAKNRLFLGNNYDGYASPSTTSLSTSSTTVGSPSISANWKQLNYMISFTVYHFWFVDVGGISASGFYRSTGGTPTPDDYPTSYPTTLAWSNMVYIGNSMTSIYAYLTTVHGTTITSSNSLGVTSSGHTITITGGPSVIGTSDQNIFKTDATYKLGVVFYDFAGRRCGVVTNDSCKETTADRTYADLVATSKIDWTLSNSSALTEIPSWASYYSILMTKCMRTSYFIQMKADGLIYIKKDSTTGVYATDATYADTHFGLGINVKSLYSNGLGYAYQEGDILKLYLSSGAAPTSLKVKDTWNDYVIVDLYNYSTYTAAVYEIYTPYTKSATEVYYEQGDMYSILNPGTSSRTYSTVLGSVKGDITSIQRTISSTPYQFEAMAPIDKYWKQWNTNGGRPNIEITAKPVQKKVSVYWSNVVMLGTEINGLSTFDSLDQMQLPVELSSIKYLGLVNKIESEGTVMLAIGEQETASLYLGEAQVFDNTGNSFLASSSGVIGNINVLRGSFGTLNPESIVRYLGSVYWFDSIKGAHVRYDNNGLTPVSNNKMMKYFRKVGQDMMSNSSLKIFGGVDPYHGEFLMYAPRASYKPKNTVLSDMSLYTTSISYSGSGSVFVSLYAGYLYKITLSSGVTASYNGESITDTFIADDSDYISISAPSSGSFTLQILLRGIYEAYDGQGGTWAYQPGIDRYTSQYSFRPEWMSLVANRLITFKAGKPYIHNSTTYNTFYGDSHHSAIAFVHNEAGNVTKTYTSFDTAGTTPDVVHVRTEIPNVQSSDIRLADFRVKEGVNYSAIYRDRLSPNVTGTADEKVSKGDVIRGEVAKFMVVFFSPLTIIRQKFADIGFSLSRGHNSTQNQ